MRYMLILTFVLLFPAAVRAEDAHAKILAELRANKSTQFFGNWDLSSGKILVGRRELFERVATYVAQNSNAQRVFDELAKEPVQDDPFFYNLQLAIVLLNTQLPTNKRIDSTALQNAYITEKKFDAIIQKNPELFLKRNLDDLLEFANKSNGVQTK